MFAEPRQLMFAENFKNSKFIRLTIIPIRISKVPLRLLWNFPRRSLSDCSLGPFCGAPMQTVKSHWPNLYLSQFFLRLLYGLHSECNGICRHRFRWEWQPFVRLWLPANESEIGCSMILAESQCEPGCCLPTAGSWLAEVNSNNNKMNAKKTLKLKHVCPSSDWLYPWLHAPCSVFMCSPCYSSKSKTCVIAQIAMRLRATLHLIAQIQESEKSDISNNINNPTSDRASIKSTEATKLSPSACA